MTLTAQTTFTIDSWDEQPIDEVTHGAKLSQAQYVKLYDGELSGRGAVKQISASTADGRTVFSAFERFKGRLGDALGSFVLHHDGVFEDGTVKSVMTVVPGSGTEGLSGMEGLITFEAGHLPSYPVVFEYQL